MVTKQAAARKFAVIGLGRFGQNLARALCATEAEVVAIDRQGRLVEQIRDDVTLAVRLDSTDAEALTAQGVHQVDVAIVGIGDDLESAALTVAVLKELGIKRIVARAENDVQARILTSIGADETASPERESARRWAHRLMLPTLTNYIELGEDHSIIYRPAPAAFHHKTLGELDLRNSFGVNLIAIERHPVSDQVDSTKKVAVPVIEVPGAGTKVLPADVLIFVGSNERLSELPEE